MFSGSAFQIRGPQTEKARSPYVFVRDRGTTRRPDDARRTGANNWRSGLGGKMNTGQIEESTVV